MEIPFLAEQYETDEAKAESREWMARKIAGVFPKRQRNELKALHLHGGNNSEAEMYRSLGIKGPNIYGVDLDPRAYRRVLESEEVRTVVSRNKKRRGTLRTFPRHPSQRMNVVEPCTLESFLASGKGAPYDVVSFDYNWNYGRRAISPIEALFQEGGDLLADEVTLFINVQASREHNNWQQRLRLLNAESPFIQSSTLNALSQSFLGSKVSEELNEKILQGAGTFIDIEVVHPLKDYFSLAELRTSIAFEVFYRAAYPLIRRLALDETMAALMAGHQSEDIWKPIIEQRKRILDTCSLNPNGTFEDPLMMALLTSTLPHSHLFSHFALDYCNKNNLFLPYPYKPRVLSATLSGIGINLARAWNIKELDTHEYTSASGTPMLMTYCHLKRSLPKDFREYAEGTSRVIGGAPTLDGFFLNHQVIRKIVERREGMIRGRMAPPIEEFPRTHDQLVEKVVRHLNTHCFESLTAAEAFKKQIYAKDVDVKTFDARLPEIEGEVHITYDWIADPTIPVDEIVAAFPEMEEKKIRRIAKVLRGK